jgi:hypothetical protein
MLNYWPTSEELKAMFMPGSKNYINERLLRTNLYSMTSDIWDKDNGISILKHLDKGTILAIVEMRYIPTSEEIDIYSKLLTINKNLVISRLLSEEFVELISNETMDFEVKIDIGNSSSNSLIELVDKKPHPFTKADNNFNYDMFLTRVSILESIGSIKESVYEGNLCFSEEDPVEIKSWVAEQIRNYKISRITQKSIERLSNIKDWTWDINDFNLNIVEYKLKRNERPGGAWKKLVTSNINYIESSKDRFPVLFALLQEINFHRDNEIKSIQILREILDCNIKLTEIEIDILNSFTFKTNKQTLEGIGKKYGLGREAVRQTKCKLQSKLTHPVLLMDVYNNYDKIYLPYYLKLI